ncbi:condensation domain-containing protein [Streptomyces sp. NPDC006259]|uniref:condensation domain-containing protein n=1 Tax=Streptomyces sp. NPDC006259 TaxID=3364740 RepID=UPI0036B921E9
MPNSPSPTTVRHPLTPGQQGMWFLDRMSGSPVYVDPMTFRLTGTLDIEAMARALAHLRGRHEALRSTFPVVDGAPVQEIGGDTHVDVPVVDLSHLPPPERESELAAVLESDVRRRFDLAKGPVMRALVVVLAPAEHVLRITLHHLVSDAWSWWNVLLPELALLYSSELTGEPAGLKPPTAQFSDFAHWQRSWSEGPGAQRQLDYWKEKLAGLEPLPVLDPAAAPVTRSAGTGRTVATQWTTVPRPVHHALREVGRRERVTPFMLLLAGFTVVLHRVSGASDVAVGTRAALRSRPEFESAAGFFVNLLVVRTDVSRAVTFRDLLGLVRRGSLGAYAHRELPFERVVEELRPRRRTGFHSLVNVLFSHQSTPEVLPAFPGLTAGLLNHDPHTLYDLDLVFYEEDGDLRALLTHDLARCTEQTATALLAEITDVLTAVAEDPGIPLDALSTTARKHHDG